MTGAAARVGEQFRDLGDEPEPKWVHKS